MSVARSERRDGIAYISATHGLSLVRVQERETGFFEDLECLLERVVPGDAPVARAPRACAARHADRADPVLRRAPVSRPVAAHHALLARQREPHRLVVDARRLSPGDCSPV